jgi:GTPase SAR1 family protein
VRTVNPTPVGDERNDVDVAVPADLQVVLRPDAETRQADLLAAVERLRMQIATLSLTLDVPDVEQARREREGLLSQLDDYLLPRLRRPGAPLLAVIGGSTGAGKSTLTNSLLRRVVSRSGVLRPTTRSPVLIHHPQDSGAFMSQRILPRLSRVTSEGPEPLRPVETNAPRITGLRLVPHEGLAPGLAIIDAPDIDSLVETNRELAVQLLQAADLWIFVTTAARYADATPWELLQEAAERGVAVAVVLDRVPPESLKDLRVHLATRLRDQGLSGVPMFVVPETETVDGFLPAALIAPLQLWLARVAGDEHARSVVSGRTLKGVLGSLPARAEVLAVAAEAQSVGWMQLHAELDAVFSIHRARLLASLVDGSLVSGELLARWQEFVAGGGFVRRLDGSSQNLADRVRSVVRRNNEDAQPLDVSVTDAVAAAVRSALLSATEDVLSRWRRYPFGTALLVTRGDQVVAGDIEPQLERAVRDWRVGMSTRITTAVESSGSATEEERTIDSQTAADVMFIVTLDQRSEQSPAPAATETVESADTVAAARRIIAGLLGAEPVQTVATAARADLISFASILLDTERRRLERLLQSVDHRTGRAATVRAAAQLVELVY